MKTTYCKEFEKSHEGSPVNTRVARCPEMNRTVRKSKKLSGKKKSTHYRTMWCPVIL